ncbi:MAG TPA: GTP cyclohydrolase I, partial [Anaeromyxobacteraceae bacterium]|nr:GTP cyclohydrolase I [Anaeromyxobacteraceae bacterium]
MRDFLAALGFDLEECPDLEETPKLVARAWAEELLDGYRAAPRDILLERLPAPRSKGSELVVLSGLAFQSVCPHHLLPYGGVAHIAYLPRAHVA